MSNVSSWTNTTLPPIHILLTSLVLCIVHFSPRELMRTSPVHPNPVIWYDLSHISLLISFLKIAIIPTYPGISIAILRYIAMQLPSSSYTWLEHSLSYCFAWSYRADMIFVSKPLFIILIYVTLDHCTSWLHCEMHSYRIILFQFIRL